MNMCVHVCVCLFVCVCVCGGHIVVPLLLTASNLGRSWAYGNMQKGEYYVESITAFFMWSNPSIAHFLAFSILYARYEAQVSISSGPFVKITMKTRLDTRPSVACSLAGGSNAQKSLFLQKCYRRTDGPMNRQTDGPMDQLTDTPYRVTSTRLKKQ